MPPCKSKLCFCCCCCCCRKCKKEDIESEDETMELEHRPRAAVPTSYGTSETSSQTESDLRPRLPTRKYKRWRERNSASASSSAVTPKQQDGSQMQRNIEALNTRHENLVSVDEVMSDLDSEAGIYSSLSAQLREKYQKKFSEEHDGEATQESDAALPQKKRKRKLKAIKRWWRKHVH